MNKETKEESQKAFKLLDLCKNEGRNKDTNKWTFDLEDLEVQCVSVFAVHQYIDECSEQSFRDWLFDKSWAKVKAEKSKLLV